MIHVYSPIYLPRILDMFCSALESIPTIHSKNNMYVKKLKTFQYYLQHYFTVSQLYFFTNVTI